MFSGALLLLGAYVAVVALVWLGQRRLIYLPFPRSLDNVSHLLPGVREMRIPVEDGVELGAWLVPGHGDRTRIVFVVFNGNAGNRSHRAPLAASLARLGFSTLLFDYRGYGDSSGRPSEAGLMRDAQAVYRHLAGELGIESSQLVYFGESLGAAVAVALAQEHPPATLVLRSPFTSLADVGAQHYRFLPVRLLLRDRWPSIRRIAEVGAPLLVLAGDRDRIVFPELSRALYEAAAQPKKWVTVPGADHNDGALLFGDLLLAETVTFVERHAGQATPP